MAHKKNVMHGKILRPESILGRANFEKTQPELLKLIDFSTETTPVPEPLVLLGYLMAHKKNDMHGKILRPKN